MPVKLQGLRMGPASGEPVVILHGLLGASRNWVTIGRSLANDFDVHLLDLRNHGGSPHADSMRWSELCADVMSYLKAQGLGPVTLIGHSLGGKVAMRLACEYPEQVGRLVIVDIAAKAYPPYHDAEFRAMKALALGELVSRKEAEAALEPSVPDWAMRQFLLTNLERDEATGRFRWQVNLEVLHASLPHIRQNSLRADDQYAGPVLLIRGERSDFVSPGDGAVMRQWLPTIQEVIVPQAGHNVHVENRKGFLEVLEAWLRDA